MTSRQNLIGWGLVILLFGGALGWAKGRDPFSRKWFTLKPASGESFKCVAVLPKPMRRYPTVIYLHESGEDILRDGTALRQMAELGLAAVSLEYNKTNEVTFKEQFNTLLHYLNQRSWVKANAIAWVGLNQGAKSLLGFASLYPEQQPQLLVQVGGAGIQDKQIGVQTNKEFRSPHCPVLLVHGEQDEAFPVADTRRLAAVLEDRGVPVELKVIPNLPHGLEPERVAIFRAAGEYCRVHLIGKDAWQTYHSTAQWQADAPTLWLWWLPAAIWVAGWVIWTVMKRVAKNQPAKTPLNRGGIVLRWLAVLLTIGVLSIAALHLVTPLFQVNNITLNLARQFLVQPDERGDFDYLAAQPIWRGHALKTLLDHVELACYNRELVNWKVDQQMYQDFVLSATITGNSNEQLDWRRPLWEEFYPRIRHENSPEDAARIVVRHLRERLTIATEPDLPQDVPAIWLKQITDKIGFEIIYAAALRSVGVPARLNSQHQTEFWSGNKWQIAPPPAIVSW